MVPQSTTRDVRRRARRRETSNKLRTIGGTTEERLKDEGESTGGRKGRWSGTPSLSQRDSSSVRMEVGAQVVLARGEPESLVDPAHDTVHGDARGQGGEPGTTPWPRDASGGGAGADVGQPGQIASVTEPAARPTASRKPRVANPSALPTASALKPGLHRARSLEQAGA